MSRVPLGGHDGRSGGSLDPVVLADSQARVEMRAWSEELVTAVAGELAGVALALFDGMFIA